VIVVTFEGYIRGPVFFTNDATEAFRFKDRKTGRGLYNGVCGRAIKPARARASVTWT